MADKKDDDDKKKKKKQTALDLLRGAVSRKSAAGILRDREEEMRRKIKEAGG